MANTEFDITQERIKHGERIAAKKRILTDIDAFVFESNKTYKQLQLTLKRQAEICIATKQLRDDIKIALGE